MIPLILSNIIDQAKETAKASKPTNYQLYATVITPEIQIPAASVETLQCKSDFMQEHSDMFYIQILIQPGVYQKSVLPYKDNLIIEIIHSQGLTQTLRRYRATPRGDTNAQQSAQTTSMVDVGINDQNQVVSVSFMLLEIGYDMLKNTQTSGCFLMANPSDVLHNKWVEEGNRLGLTGAESFKGVDIEEPIDNERIYRQIMVKQGVPLVSLGNYLQNEEGLGMYTRGLGSYYRKGMWYIYPLCKSGRYGKVKHSLDIIKAPQDVLPTLNTTYFVNDTSVLIISTGSINIKDGTDKMRQNLGSGQQVISSDAVAGDTGTHYAKGRAITTRTDTASEYRTTMRSSGVDRTVLNSNPTNNIFKEITSTAMRDTSILTLEWHNSDPDVIYPGAPVNFYYLQDDSSLTLREGTVVEIDTLYQPTKTGANVPFSRSSILTILLMPEINTVVTPNS